MSFFCIKLESCSEYYFHIGEDSYPEHCSNCVHDVDKGEIDMDCGGPCKPCGNAPKTMSIDNSVLANQNWYVASEQLSTEGEVTFKNREVPYELIAGEAVVLNEGFSLESDANFSIQIDSDPTNFVREFSHICQSFTNIITPDGDGDNDVWNIILVGYIKLEVIIKNVKGTEMYYNTKAINSDGKITIWDGRKNGKRVPSGPYFWYMWLKDYKGKEHEFSGSLTVLYND